LDRWEIFWALGQTHQHQSGAYRSAAHQEALMTRPHQFRNFCSKPSKLLGIQ
jgi:hypothetical protein